MLPLWARTPSAFWQRSPASGAEANVNVEEVTQSILAGTFAMIMVVDIARCNVEFDELQRRLAAAGEEKGVDVKVTRQEIYDAMHHI